jgi:GH25 family lysozyme M1 (1,4-beta-N-acetylmuramidase)
VKTKKTGKRLYSTGNPRKKKGIEVRVPAALICCVILTAGCLAGCGGAPKTSASAASDIPAAPAESDTAEGSAVSEKPADTADSADRAESAGTAPASSGDTSAAAAGTGSTSAAAAGTDSETAGGRLLKYIDAWEEWHTMTVDPDVRETAYNASQFISAEENPQWMIYTGKGSEEYECLQGIDVSEHQGTIDWQAVAEAGYQFAFIRVGFRGYGEAGTLVEDSMAVENLQQAQAAGLHVGTYFFSQALNEEEAAEEAALSVSVIEKSGVEPDLPLMYDPEIIKDDDGRANDITRDQVALNTAAFRETVETSSTCRVDIYSNLPWEHNYFDTDTMNRYEIWYADYEPLPQTPYHFTWWQYTNEGTVPGIEGVVDLDLWLRKK